MIPVTRTPAYEFSEKASQKQLGTHYHGKQTQVKQRPFRHLVTRIEDFCIGKIAGDKKTKQKQQGPDGTKQMHRFPSESRHKHNGYQV